MLFIDNKLRTRDLRQRKKERAKTLKLLITSIFVCILLVVLAFYLYITTSYSENNNIQKGLENKDNDLEEINGTQNNKTVDSSDIANFYNHISYIFNALFLEINKQENFNEKPDIEITFKLFGAEKYTVIKKCIEKVDQFVGMVSKIESNIDKLNELPVFLYLYFIITQIYEVLSTIENDKGTIEIENKDICGINVLFISRMLDPILESSIKILTIYSDRLTIYMKGFVNNKDYTNVLYGIENALIDTSEQLLREKNIMNDKVLFFKAYLLIKKFLLLSYYPFYVLLFQLNTDENSNKAILNKQYIKYIERGVANKRNSEEEEIGDASETAYQISEYLIVRLESDCADVFTNKLTENIDNRDILKIQNEHCFKAVNESFFMVNHSPTDTQAIIVVENGF